MHYEREIIVSDIKAELAQLLTLPANQRDEAFSHVDDFNLLLDQALKKVMPATGNNSDDEPLRDEFESPFGLEQLTKLREELGNSGTNVQTRSALHVVRQALDKVQDDFWPNTRVAQVPTGRGIQTSTLYNGSALYAWSDAKIPENFYTHAEQAKNLGVHITSLSYTKTLETLRAAADRALNDNPQALKADGSLTLTLPEGNVTFGLFCAADSRNLARYGFSADAQTQATLKACIAERSKPNASYVDDVTAGKAVRSENSRG